MKTYEKNVIREIGEFLWDGFTDPDGLGVDAADILDGAALAGLHLTEAQKESVITHMEDVDSWSDQDEAVRDLIADATDDATYEQLFAWLAFVVGDTTAEIMVKEWEE